MASNLSATPKFTSTYESDDEIDYLEMDSYAIQAIQRLTRDAPAQVSPDRDPGEYIVLPISLLEKELGDAYIHGLYQNFFSIDYAMKNIRKLALGYATLITPKNASQFIIVHADDLENEIEMANSHASFIPGPDPFRGLPPGWLASLYPQQRRHHNAFRYLKKAHGPKSGIFSPIGELYRKIAEHADANHEEPNFDAALEELKDGYEEIYHVMETASLMKPDQDANTNVRIYLHAANRGREEPKLGYDLAEELYTGLQLKAYGGPKRVEMKQMVAQDWNSYEGYFTAIREARRRAAELEVEEKEHVCEKGRGWGFCALM